MEASRFLESYKPDLLILDLMLPLLDGFGVLEQIRKVNQKIPILILSARNQAADKLRGFKEGVDDYLTKPFELDEFLARVQRLLLRSSWNSDEKGDLEDNLERQLSFWPSCY